jgi:tetratricopeptide (TPR) repeat protein
VFKHLIAVMILAAPAAAGARQPSARQPAAPADLATVSARLEKAAVNGDVPGMKDARAACLQMLAAVPIGAKETAGQAAMLHYTVAYASWRLAFAPAVPPEQQIAMLTDAESHLNEAVKLDPSFADAYGLLASVYGAQIGKNPDLGMTLGEQVGEILGRALSLDANNPRLLLIQGLIVFHTPPEFGGDPKQGEALLRRGLQLFAQEPAARPWPNWGRYDTHAWLGQMLFARGDKEGARAEYNAALAIAPGSGYVKYLLSQLK